MESIQTLLGLGRAGQSYHPPHSHRTISNERRLAQTEPPTQPNLPKETNVPLYSSLRSDEMPILAFPDSLFTPKVYPFESHAVLRLHLSFVWAIGICTPTCTMEDRTHGRPQSYLPKQHRSKAAVAAVATVGIRTRWYLQRISKGTPSNRGNNPLHSDSLCKRN